MTTCTSLLKTKFNKCAKKRDTALKNFAIQYRIKRSNGYDPGSFMLNSKEPITNLMINIRQTKVKLILSCVMEKVGPKSGEVIVKKAAFHSKTKGQLREY